MAPANRLCAYHLYNSCPSHSRSYNSSICRFVAFNYSQDRLFYCTALSLQSDHFYHPIKFTNLLVHNHRFSCINTLSFTISVQGSSTPRRITLSTQLLRDISLKQERVFFAIVLFPTSKCYGQEKEHGASDAYMLALQRWVHQEIWADHCDELDSLSNE